MLEAARSLSFSQQKVNSTPTPRMGAQSFVARRSLFLYPSQLQGQQLKTKRRRRQGRRVVFRIQRRTVGELTRTSATRWSKTRRWYNSKKGAIGVAEAGGRPLISNGCRCQRWPLLRSSNSPSITGELPKSSWCD